MDMKAFFDTLTREQRNALLDAAGVPQNHRRLIGAAVATMKGGFAVASLLTGAVASVTAALTSLMLWPVFKGAKTRLTSDPIAMARFTVALREAKAAAGLNPDLSSEAADLIRRAMGDRRGPSSTLN